MIKRAAILCLLLASCATPSSLEEQLRGRWKITKWADLNEQKQYAEPPYPLNTRVHFKKSTVELHGKYRWKRNPELEGYFEPGISKKIHEEYEWRQQNDSLFIRNNFIAFKIKEINKKQLLLELYGPKIFDTTGTQFIHDEITLKRSTF